MALLWYRFIAIMACNVCKTKLAEGDKHFGCLRHRNCTRSAPCSLDVDEPAHYWDEVEEILAAVHAVSPGRRSSLRVHAKNVDQGSRVSSADLPPPPPNKSGTNDILSSKHSSSKPIGKKPKKVAPKKANKHQSTKKSSSSQQDKSVDESRPPLPRGSVRGAERDRGRGKQSLPPRNDTLEEDNSDIFVLETCTSKGQGEYVSSETQPSDLSGNLDSSGTGQVSSCPSVPVAGKNSVTVTAGQPRQEMVLDINSSQDLCASEKTRRAFDPCGQRQVLSFDRPAMLNVRDSTMDEVVGEVEVHSSASKDGSRRRTDDSVRGANVSETISVGNIDQYQTVTAQETSMSGSGFRIPAVVGPTTGSVNRFSTVSGSGDSRVPAVAVNQQTPTITTGPIPNQSFTCIQPIQGMNDAVRLGGQQQSSVPDQFGGMMSHWMPPWGFNMTNPVGWCPWPMTTPPTAAQFSQPSSGAVVTTQPQGSLIQSQPVASLPATLSVPSRRDIPRRGDASNMTSITPSVQQTASHLEEVSDSDQDYSPESDAASSTLGNEADLFREESVSVGRAQSLDQDDEDNDEQDEKDKKIFSADRIDPILRSAAQLAGAEFMDSKESKSSLLFGQSGLKHTKSSPILCMPPDIYELRDEARTRKISLGKVHALTTIFRVPEDDFKELFRTPDLGKDVEAFLKKSPGVQPSYIKAWEVTLKKLDRDLRAITRLASFQLLVANAMAIQLSDSSDAAERDSPFQMARLSADLSARQTAVLMQLSAQTVHLRRENVFASVKGVHKDKLVSKLKDMSITSDSLFGEGGFTSTVKKTAKDVDSERTLGARFRSFGPSSSASARSRKSGRGAKGGSRYHPYANQEAKDLSRRSQPTISYRSQSSGGTDNRTSSRSNRGSQQKRGRGRGKPGNRRF